MYGKEPYTFAQYRNDVIEGFAFKPLHNSPREVWLVYTLVVLDAAAQFASSYIMVLYLSHDFGFDDEDAAWIYGAYGMAISVFSIILGWIVDVIGVKFTLIIAHVIIVVGRLFLAFTMSKDVILVTLFVTLPIGSALVIPAMTTGIRRYTNDSNRAAAFGLYVMMLHLGALIAAPIVDIVRSTSDDQMIKKTGEFNNYRIILFIASITSAVSMIFCFFFREIDVDSEGRVQEFQIKESKPLQIMSETFSSKRFWKFMLFVFLLVGIRFIFRHLDATFPKYMVRTFGKEVPFAMIIAINPFLIILTIPMITPLTKFVSLYKIILIGSTVTALSVLWMLAGPYIWPSILFIVTLSIGEATWAPRLFEYSCMIAPKGREGTFMACANAPMFFAKLGVGGISGWLLTKYCPDTSTPQNHQCDGFNLWLWVFIMTASSPVLMLLLQPCIEQEGENITDMNGVDDDDHHESFTPLTKNEDVDPSYTATKPQ
eukprot:c12885_g1_i1.p1 GENE.c12885_g1_i1~~c12885_g1_i1.p1  ORF type:complete len:485 (-),score=167.01 c12885_g1_i1:69-1523(-)